LVIKYLGNLGEPCMYINVLYLYLFTYCYYIPSISLRILAFVSHAVSYVVIQVCMHGITHHFYAHSDVVVVGFLKHL
jgi:hypothetical protein